MYDILGPRNIPLERENPDELAAPATDHGTVPNLKFPLAAAHNRLATTPRDVLSQNFGVPRSALNDIPIDVDRERYIFPAALPGPMACDTVESASAVPQSFSHRLMDQEPIKAAGGQVRIVDSSNF